MNRTCRWTYDSEIDGWQTECGETHLRQGSAIFPIVAKDPTVCEFCKREKEETADETK